MPDLSMLITLAEYYEVDVKEIIAYAGDMAQGKIQCRLYENQKERVAVPKEDWIVVENTHEPLVSKKDFKLASKRVNEELNMQISQAATAPKRIRKNAIYENVFGDVVYCGDC